MNNELLGKTIVVTGANGVLGSAICQELAAYQANVIATDIQDTWHHKTAVTYRYMDITSEESVEQCIQHLSVIDGWVNNAYPRTSDWGTKFESIPFDSWRRNVDMHLNGYVLCCQKALEKMKEHHKGTLINISSIYGAVGPDFTVYEGTDMTMPGAYAAIKGAITNLTRYLASYYGPYSIRVNTVSPGGIFADQPKSFVTRYCQKVPLHRMATPQDIVGVVRFLLSDAASYITGQDLKVDGGWCAI